MRTGDKLMLRFRSKPKDFTFGELERLIKSFGYLEDSGSGKRVVFINSMISHKIKLHKPHPGNILKHYQMDLTEQELQNKNLL